MSHECCHHRISKKSLQIHYLNTEHLRNYFHKAQPNKFTSAWHYITWTVFSFMQLLLEQLELQQIWNCSRNSFVTVLPMTNTLPATVQMHAETPVGPHVNCPLLLAGFWILNFLFLLHVSKQKVRLQEDDCITGTVQCDLCASGRKVCSIRTFLPKRLYTDRLEQDLQK